MSLPRALSSPPAGWRPAGGLEGWVVVEVELVEEEVVEEEVGTVVV